jgi:hypothetical protein
VREAKDDMTSAGKWVLGLLLLVVGAVFVARTVSSDPGSQAQVKNLPSAALAGEGTDKAAAAAAAATAKKVAGTVAGDVSCKKACVEVNEVANDSVTTAKLAPGSVTLSKLAFEVPNLNELENEINARKIAEATTKAAQAEAAASGAKNDAAITAAASNGITAESAARTAADEDLVKKTAAADADLVSKLNGEVKDRGSADDVLQGKLNTEIADRTGAVINLKSELFNGNQVDAPIVQINNNEIVGDAITGNKILDTTITALDLGDASVVGGLAGDIKDGTITADDLALDSVVGGLGGDIKDNTVDENDLKSDSVIGGLGGDVKDGTIDQNDLALAGVIGGLGGDVADNTIDENDLKLQSVIGGLGGDVKDNTIDANDLALGAVIGGLGGDVVDGSISLHDLGDGSVVGGENGDVTDGTINEFDLALAAVIGGTGGDVKDGTITGQGDNDDSVAIDADNTTVTGDLALNTVGRRNIVASAVDSGKIADDTVAAVDLANNAVVGRALAADSGLVNIKLGTIRGEGAPPATGSPGGDIALGTITGEGDNDAATSASGNLGLGTVGRANLVAGVIDVDQLDDDLELELVTETELTAFLARFSDVTATPTDLGTPAVPKPNNSDSFVDWSKLKNVPNGLDDNVDDDGNGKVQALVTKLATSQPSSANMVHWDNLGSVPALVLNRTAAFVDCAAACVEDGEISTVSFSKITGVDVVSTQIQNGTITAIDLAGEDDSDPVTPGPQGVVNGAVDTEKILDLTITSRDLAGTDNGTTESVVGAVTSEKIANGTITARDLADGAVITDKLLANVSSLGTSPTATLDTATSLTGTVGTTTLALTAGAHKVIVTGQTVANCTCAGGDTAVLTYRALNTAAGPPGTTVPVGPTYTITLTNSSPRAVLAVSGLASYPGTALAVTHTYGIEVTSVPSAPAAIVGLTGAQTTAADLGR